MTDRVNLKEVMVTGICPKCHKYRLKRNSDGDMECLCGFIIYSNGLTSQVDPLSKEIVEDEDEEPIPRAQVVENVDSSGWTTPTGAIDTTKLPKTTILHGMQRALCNGCGVEFDKPGATIKGGRRSFHNLACRAGKKRESIAKATPLSPPTEPVVLTDRAPQLTQQQIDEIKDYAYCLKALQLTQVEMLSIKGKVQIAQGDIKAGRPIDRDWFSRLNKARVHHSQQYGALSSRLSQLKREQNHLRANNFERIFISSAKSILPKEVFDTIFKQAMDSYVVDHQGKGSDASTR